MIRGNVCRSRMFCTVSTWLFWFRHHTENRRQRVKQESGDTATVCGRLEWPWTCFGFLEAIMTTYDGNVTAVSRRDAGWEAADFAVLVCRCAAAGMAIGRPKPQLRDFFLSVGSAMDHGCPSSKGRSWRTVITVNLTAGKFEFRLNSQDPRGTYLHA